MPFFLLFIAFAQFVIASPRCDTFYAGLPQEISQRAAWPLLRQRKQLIDQHTIPGKNSLCGPVCVLNTFQAAATISNLEPIKNPQHILENLVKKYQIDEGLTAIELLSLTREVFSQASTDLSPVVTLAIAEGVGKDSDTTRVIRKLSKADLSPKEKQLKILLTVQLDPAGFVVYHHAQIVSGFDGRIMTVVDPNKPYVDLQVERDGSFGVNNNAFPRMYYRNSDRPFGIQSFVPYGVITIDLSGEKGASTLQSKWIAFWKNLAH